MTMVKVGLVTRSGTPNPRASPRVKAVFPAPRSPVKATTVPAVSRGDVLYLPAATIESLTGIAAQVDEAAQTVTVTLPAAPEEAQ